MNRKNTAFVQQGFEWYRWDLTQNILIQNGELSHFAYMNIVGMGLNQAEFDWVANFIPRYAVYLPKQY